MTDDETPSLGNHDLDLPYEDVPGGAFDLTSEFHLSGGVTIAAAVVPVPGLAPMPALRFVFVDPAGRPYPPLLLIADDDQLGKLVPLVAASVEAAVDAARAAR